MRLAAIIGIMGTVFLLGCKSLDRPTAQTEETAIIACEAAHVTIQMKSFDHANGETNTNE